MDKKAALIYYGSLNSPAARESYGVEFDGRGRFRIVRCSTDVEGRAATFPVTGWDLAEGLLDSHNARTLGAGSDFKLEFAERGVTGRTSRIASKVAHQFLASRTVEEEAALWSYHNVTIEEGGDGSGRKVFVLQGEKRAKGKRTQYINIQFHSRSEAENWVKYNMPGAKLKKSAQLSYLGLG